MKSQLLLLCFIAVLLLFSTNVSLAQKSDSISRAQNAYVEVGGAGLTFSANYDTRFAKKRNGLGGRIGIGYLSQDNENILSVPVGLNYLLGKGKNFFEIGIGASYVDISGGATNSVTYTNPYGYSETIVFEESESPFKESGVLGTLTFGYRLQPLDNGFSFRGSFNPLLGYGSFIPYGGISFGYTF